MKKSRSRSAIKICVQHPLAVCLYSRGYPVKLWYSLFTSVCSFLFIMKIAVNMQSVHVKMINPKRYFGVSSPALKRSCCYVNSWVCFNDKRFIYWSQFRQEHLWQERRSSRATSIESFRRATIKNRNLRISSDKSIPYHFTAYHCYGSSEIRKP